MLPDVDDQECPQHRSQDDPEILKSIDLDWSILVHDKESYRLCVEFSGKAQAFKSTSTAKIEGYYKSEDRKLLRLVVVHGPNLCGWSFVIGSIVSPHNQLRRSCHNHPNRSPYLQTESRIVCFRSAGELTEILKIHLINGQFRLGPSTRIELLHGPPGASGPGTIDLYVQAAYHCFIWPASGTPRPAQANLKNKSGSSPTRTRTPRLSTMPVMMPLTVTRTVTPRTPIH
jgi:hypothetical protein